MEQDEEKNIIIEFQRKVLQEANCTAEMLAYLDEIDDDVFREYYCICALDGMTVEEIRRIDSIAVQDWRVKIKHIKEERLNFLENIFVPNSEMQKQISELHDKAGKVKIASRPALEGLVGFDPKMEYGGEKRVESEGKEHYYRGGHEYQLLKKTDTEMGKISNLITDMTLAGADDNKMARAVRHSMVVIDAEKHHLDYKQSEIDNNIPALKKEYQAHYDSTGHLRFGGASTLISRAKGEIDVDKRQGQPHPNLKGKPDYSPSTPNSVPNSLQPTGSLSI